MIIETHGGLGPHGSAGDFKWRDEAMWETFYLRIVSTESILECWSMESLEKKVRDWALFSQRKSGNGPLVWEIHMGQLAKTMFCADAFFKAVLAGEQSIAFVM